MSEGNQEPQPGGDPTLQQQNHPVQQPSQQQPQEADKSNHVQQPHQQDQAHNQQQSKGSSSPSYSDSKSNDDQVQDLRPIIPPAAEGESDIKKQQPTNPNEVQKTRYKYCCKVCKHTGQGKRACVCVVPLTERRTIIGDQGCQTCRCKGCSIEDFVARGQDPVYRIVKINKQDIFDPKRMCCKKCMKAFYNNGKPCFCQYPPKQRKNKLKPIGCSLCGCNGCNTDDYVKEKPKQKRRSKSRSREKRRRNRRSRSRSSSSRSSKRSRSSSVEPVDVKNLNLNNFDRSYMGNMIINEFRVFPALLGFGIPQRTQSYIMCKPK